MALDADDVIKQFGGALARIAASYERNPSLRDELIQEVLIAVVTALPRLSDPGKVKPFVFRIAHDRCLSHVTKRVQEREREQQLPRVEAELPDQESLILARERGATLMEAVRRLALPYRFGASCAEVHVETASIAASNAQVAMGRLEEARTVFS